MKVALLTMFAGLSTTYSLVNVVAEQLKMLLDSDHDIKVLVSDTCPDEEREGIFTDERIEWVKVVNTIDGELIHWRDYTSPTGDVHETFFKEADVIAEDFVDKLSDVSVCIMHDIHYQGWHLIHNVAIRKAQKKLPNTKFFAVTHSVPAKRPITVEWPLSARYTPMPNTTYVYPTQSGISALAHQFNVPEGRCRVISNSLNLTEFMSDEVRTISRKFDFLSSDIFVVYPSRLTTAKKFDKVAALCGAIKKVSEYNVKVLFCDFPSQDTEGSAYKSQVTLEGYKHGLDADDLAFTSELGFKYGFPRIGVLELLSLSNLFICPSFSESFGLTVLEAASKGNFIVLNEKVPALEELGKKLKAHFMRWDALNFGFNTKEAYTPSEHDYYLKHAESIIDKMRDNPVIHAKTITRQRFSPEWVWKNQLEPLIEGY